MTTKIFLITFDGFFVLFCYLFPLKSLNLQGGREGDKNRTLPLTRQVFLSTIYQCFYCKITQKFYKVLFNAYNYMDRFKYPIMYMILFCECKAEEDDVFVPTAMIDSAKPDSVKQ